MLWEILVPDSGNNAHKDIENFIVDYADGFTIYSRAIGYWQDPHGNLIQDVINPYRIKCSEKEIKLIAQYVKARAKQFTVMYYLVSSQIELI